MKKHIILGLAAVSLSCGSFAVSDEQLKMRDALEPYVVLIQGFRKDCTINDKTMKWFETFSNQKNGKWIKGTPKPSNPLVNGPIEVRSTSQETVFRLPFKLHPEHDQIFSGEITAVEVGKGNENGILWYALEFDRNSKEFIPTLKKAGWKVGQEQANGSLNVIPSSDKNRSLVVCDFSN